MTYFIQFRPCLSSFREEAAIEFELVDVSISAGEHLAFSPFDPATGKAFTGLKPQDIEK